MAFAGWRRSSRVSLRRCDLVPCIRSVQRFGVAPPYIARRLSFVLLSHRVIQIGSITSPPPLSQLGGRRQTHSLFYERSILVTQFAKVGSKSLSPIIEMRQEIQTWDQSMYANPARLIQNEYRPCADLKRESGIVVTAMSKGLVSRFRRLSNVCKAANSSRQVGK